MGFDFAKRARKRFKPRPAVVDDGTCSINPLVDIHTVVVVKQDPFGSVPRLARSRYQSNQHVSH